MKVEMRPAYQWICDECGREQFESCQIAEWSDEDRIQYAREIGLIDEWCESLPEDLAGDFITYPSTVTCEGCGASFETQHHSEDLTE